MKIEFINPFSEEFFSKEKELSDIQKSQITSGLTDSLGIDPRVLLSSLMGSKLAGVGGKTEPKQLNG